MAKTKEMEETLETVVGALFGNSRKASMQNSKCVTCGEHADHFEDALSRKEYGISGMCQVCQDEVFG
jgi:hypothetical protein